MTELIVYIFNAYEIPIHSPYIFG